MGFSSRIVGQTLEEEHMLLQIEHDNLTDAIHLRIVSSLRDTPEYVLLVFHPEAQKNLAVSGGTCFLDASTNDTHVVQIVQQPGKALCSQLILGARGLGNAIVTIQDISLSPRATTDSLVRVANVDWVQIMPEENISLMEGSTKDFQISTGTQDGQVFGDSQVLAGATMHLYFRYFSTNICNTELLPAHSPWTCPGDNVFYDASVIWGLISPRRIFGDLGTYSVVNWFFLGGAIAPLLVWFAHKAFPSQNWVLLINMPVLIGATGQMPPATAVNYTTWILVGFLSGYMVYKYRRD